MTAAMQRDSRTPKRRGPQRPEQVSRRMESLRRSLATPLPCRQCGQPYTRRAAAQFYCSPQCSNRQKHKPSPSRLRPSRVVYQDLLRLGRGVCEICGRTNGARRLAVDHDHNTGKVRGLLCHRCNAGLGLFRDDPSILTLAREYLLAHSEAA